ncbi:MAG: heme lyase CcmF/NrfE family subunit [Actinobacteria bacterium]|nr:heme lyase CcmF/NrfE family subunit [Actinomycetota bacterium]
MIELGAVALVIAFATALFATGAALWGTRGDRRFVESSRRAVYALAGLLTICIVVVEVAFVNTDFSLKLAADYTSTTTPLFYRLVGMYSSQEGSLLLFAWVLSLATSLALRGTRDRHREIVPWATAVLAGLASFFTGLMLFEANPFARLDPAPAQGFGLEPLLRYPEMAMHPPLLYSGYVGFAIPFAFAIGALITRRLDASWLRSTRRFALIAWVFLGLGLIFGSRWSYSVLGWGGYWAWDPVENAALMPWLVGTAFLHSSIVQEKRGILRTWNVVLICATFSLALLGTFLVRSGALQSIHSFGASTVGAPLLGLIAVVVVGSTLLIVSRLDELRAVKRIESLASREAVFLVNNLLLVGLAAVVFWGTFFPLISEAATGQKASLAAPWFDRYAAPLGILLVLFTGIGPLLAWGRVSRAALKRLLLAPALLALLVALALLAFTDAGSKPLALLTFVCAAFALAGIVQEFARGAAARRSLVGGSYAAALGGMVVRNRRRYGGYIAHAGIAILFVAVAASSSFQSGAIVRLGRGQSAEVGGYRFTYTRPTVSVDQAEQRLALGSVVKVTQDGRPVTTLHPARLYYSTAAPSEGAALRGFFEGTVNSQIGRQTGVGRDLWTAMNPDLSRFEPFITGFDRRLDRLAAKLPANDPRVGAQLSSLEGMAINVVQRRYMADPPPAEFRINVFPFVVWLWIGAGVAAVGGLIAIWPAPEARRRRVSGLAAARLGRGSSVET